MPLFIFYKMKRAFS